MLESVAIKYRVAFVLCLTAILVGVFTYRNKEQRLPRTVPVAGRVKLQGASLRLKENEFGRVWFFPDAGRGNACREVAVGEIDGEGNYELVTAGQTGAQPGWYRVMVVASTRSDSLHAPRERRHLVNSRFASIDTSGLQLEVLVEPSSEAYDINVTR
jgi:hypothetical protein